MHARNAFVALAAVACLPPQPEVWSDCDALDPIDVEGAMQVGDALEVDVTYGGGCEDHRFSICWPDQAFLESAPVQVNAVLWHDIDDRRGNCDALVGDTVTFDLAPLYTAFDDAYGSPGQLIVNLDGQSATVDVPGQ